MRWPVVRAGPAVAGLTAFSAAAVGAGLGRALVTSYLPVALARIRDAPGLIGMVMLVNVAAGLAVPLWVGAWSDRLRGRGHGRTIPFVLGGSAVTAAGLAGIALVAGTGYLPLALAAAVAYVGLNAVTTAHRALIPENFAPALRARATSAEELAMMGGTLAGVGAGGLLIEAATWAPFALGALAVPALAVPTVRRMRRREAPPAGPAPERLPWGYYLRAAARPGVRLILAAQALWVLGYAALPAFFVLYAERALGLRPSAAGGLLIGFGAVTALAMLAAGAARDEARHVPLLALGAALMGAGLIGLAAATSSWAAAPGLIAAAAGFGVVSTLGFPVLSAGIPAGEAGAYTALYFAVRAVAGAVALPAAGWAIALTGSYRTLPAAGGAAALTALVPLALLGRDGLRARLAGLERPRCPPARFLAAWCGTLAGALGLALALGLLAAGTALARADAAGYRALNELGPGWPVIDRILVAPDFRNYALLTVLTAAAALVWRRAGVIRAVVCVVLAGGIAFGLVRAIWAVWDRARPEEVLDGARIGSHLWAPYPSFPSGHVAVTTAMVVVMGVLFPRLRLPLWAFAGAVAVTRVIFGAHFPSDVAVGLLVAAAGAWAAWALLAAAGLLPPWRPRLGRRRFDLPPHLGRQSRPDRRHTGGQMTLQLGAEAPDFEADTTEGRIRFHEWIGDDWAVLFSHPKDFTPVCTTELGYMARVKPEFDRRGVKIIGLSVDPLGRHEQWAKDIEETQGTAPNYPIIADADFRVSKLYGMLPAEVGGDPVERTPADNQTVRNVFVIGPDKKVRLVLVYPMTTGRNFDEVLRVVDSLQLTARHKVSTPAQWQQGDDVIIAGSVSDEQAREIWPDGWESPRPYIRIVPQPAD